MLNQTIERNIKEEFTHATKVTENFISFLAQTSLVWLDHTITDNALNKQVRLVNSLEKSDKTELRKLLDIDKKLVSADTLVLLNEEFDVVVEINSAFKEGMNLKHFDLIKEISNTEDAANKIIRENESFILYSAKYITDHNDEPLGVLMMGYFINDIFLEQVKLSTELEMAVVGNSAIMSSTSWGGKTLDFLPVNYLEYQKLLKGSGTKYIKHNGKRYLISAKPLNMLESSLSGSLLLGYESKEIEELQAEVLNQSFMILFSVLLIAIVASLLFSSRIIDSIRRLKEHAQVISEGNYSHRIELKSKDEFSTLAKNFNKMALTIEQKNKELSEYAESLEKKVEKRTQQLKEANYSLEQNNETLQSSIDEYSKLLDSTLEAIFILEDGVIRDLNSEAVELLGYEHKDELLNLPIFNYIRHESQVIFEENLSFDENFELTFVDHEKLSIPVMVKLSHRSDQQLILSVVDLTQLKQRDQILAHQSKMASMGQMIESIAHQWRQPLSVISANASSIQMYHKLGKLTEEKSVNFSESILKSTNYLSETIDDFRNFFRDDKERSIFNLDQNIQNTLALMAPNIKKNHVELICEVDSSLMLKGYPNEMTQVILNIVNNAIDAFGEEIENQDRIIVIKGYQYENKVRLEIQDSAGGIDKSVIDKIFELYFTTKHQSQGTGIGLYMVHQIITLHMSGSIFVENSRFEVDDRKLKGAKFVIDLEFEE